MQNHQLLLYYANSSACTKLLQIWRRWLQTTLFNMDVSNTVCVCACVYVCVCVFEYERGYVCPVLGREREKVSFSTCVRESDILRICVPAKHNRLGEWKTQFCLWNVNRQGLQLTRLIKVIRSQFYKIKIVLKSKKDILALHQLRSFYFYTIVIDLNNTQVSYIERFFCLFLWKNLVMYKLFRKFGLNNFGVKRVNLF